ncbi:hypothetical protein ACFLQL_04200 [Verrucomicrobiota bacterium]
MSSYGDSGQIETAHPGIGGKESEMNMALNDLIVTIEQLERLNKTMNARLTPILRVNPPVPDAPNPDKVMPEGGTTVPLVGALQLAKERITKVIDTMTLTNETLSL